MELRPPSALLRGRRVVLASASPRRRDILMLAVCFRGGAACGMGGAPRDVTGTSQDATVSGPRPSPQGLKFDVIPSRFEEERVTSARCPGSFALEMATGKALEVARRVCLVGLPRDPAPPGTSEPRSPARARRLAAAETGSPAPSVPQAEQPEPVVVVGADTVVVGDPKMAAGDPGGRSSAGRRRPHPGPSPTSALQALEGRILGKPADREEAFWMLSGWAGPKGDRGWAGNRAEEPLTRPLPSSSGQPEREGARRVHGRRRGDMGR